jgi:ubiquinone/menaquinone biosynthesis C-methylase UbiE
MVAEKCGFTRPWLDLTKKDILRYRSGALNHHEQLQNMFPANILCDVDGADVLYLAFGGGQQSAVFGLLGAQVTVVDFSEKQLEGDRKAAAHYGFEVTTIQADMRDLSSSADSSFDLVYQAPSMAYIPDVRGVYAEVSRVLRTGGYYRVAHTNPAIEFIEMDSWDGEGYRISVPYAVHQIEYGEEGSIQFRHYLADIFNGLLAEGLSIVEVQEAPNHLKPDMQADPGTWEHIQMYVPWIFAIVARKQ